MHFVINLSHCSVIIRQPALVLTWLKTVKWKMKKFEKPAWMDIGDGPACFRATSYRFLTYEALTQCSARHDDLCIEVEIYVYIRIQSSPTHFQQQRRMSDILRVQGKLVGTLKSYGFPCLRKPVLLAVDS